MESVVFYPKPSPIFVQQFKRIFGEYHVPSVFNVLCSGDKVVGLVTVGFTINYNTCNPNILGDDVTFEYLFSGVFRLKGYKIYDSIHVKGNYYHMEYVIPCVRLLRQNERKEIDFWLLHKPSKGQPLLGLGNENGFLLIAPMMHSFGFSASIEKFVTRKRKKYVLKKPDKKIDIQVPDHIIEKWIRELGLDF